MTQTTSWLLTAFAAIALLGCSETPKKAAPPVAATATQLPRANSAPSAEITNTDPCAMRLHDLCGPLLLFYATHRGLPNNLRELSDEYDVGELVCPVSQQRYVYDPEGKRGSDAKTRIIIYDATPAHSGIRWGIGLIEAEPGVAPVAKVVAVPDQIIPMKSR